MRLHNLKGCINRMELIAAVIILIYIYVAKLSFLLLCVKLVISIVKRQTDGIHVFLVVGS